MQAPPVASSSKRIRVPSRQQLVVALLLGLTASVFAQDDPFADFIRKTTVAEQEILVHLVVEPIPPEEVDRFDEPLARHHYL